MEEVNVLLVGREQIVDQGQQIAHSLVARNLANQIGETLRRILAIVAQDRLLVVRTVQFVDEIEIFFTFLLVSKRIFILNL